MVKNLACHRPVCSVVVHPKKPVVVTASDDATWRMWGLPAGDLIMTGDGHKDWVSGLSFHPRFTIHVLLPIAANLLV